MLCSRVQNLLSAYCDREVMGDEMLRIREHLRDCATCRQEYEALRRIKLLLGSLGPPEPSRPFTIEMLHERARARRRGLFGFSLRPNEFRTWLLRVNAASPLVTPGHLALTGAVALGVLAAGLFQTPQPPDAVVAHVPEVFVSDLPPALSAEPGRPSFYPSVLTPAGYSFQPGRPYPRGYPDALISPAPGPQPAVFIVPAPRRGDH